MKYLSSCQTMLHKVATAPLTRLSNISSTGRPSRLKTNARFISTFIRSPRQVGSICPSSRYLVKTLIRQMPDKADGLILDLGSGTGIISGALLCNGEQPSSVIAIECCKEFADKIQKSYPEITVIDEDACKLEAILERRGLNQPVRAIISSLPFRSLPKGVGEAIATELKSIMQKNGGLLIQYSYAWWMRYPLAQYGFTPVRRSYVARNIPPAIVEVYSIS